MAAFHVGDRVRFVNDKKMKNNPYFYPFPGTVGSVKKVNENTVLIELPRCTCVHDEFYADPQDLEKVVNADE